MARLSEGECTSLKFLTGEWEYKIVKGGNGHDKAVRVNRNKHYAIQ